MGNPELRSRMQTEWFYVLLSRGKTSQVTCILAISHRLTRLRLSPLAQASFIGVRIFLAQTYYWFRACLLWRAYQSLRIHTLCSLRVCHAGFNVPRCRDPPLSI
jgi:hypothetical protein